ncbi:MAG: hypothetical protein EAY75_15055 [Bacteroidetes bacterium]|nr:MAG: hypothetical protein EAY75_15055 [Bacteroidota bacterium]
MAATIDDIKKRITDAYMAQPEVAALYALVPGKSFDEQFSAASIESLLFYAVAYGFLQQQQLFELLQMDTSEVVARMRPGSLQWYAEKAKLFQYGSALPPDTDLYNNAGLTEDFVKAQKIVAQAAVSEVDDGLRLKVAKLVGTSLGRLEIAELLALNIYMQAIKYAGIKLLVTSGPPDELKLELLVKIDALVLNLAGQRIDGTNNEPVQSAVKNVLQTLPFNGVLELDKMIDQVQRVPGVLHAYVTAASARYGTLPFSSLQAGRYVPDAGYLAFANIGADLIVNFTTP